MPADAAPAYDADRHRGQPPGQGCAHYLPPLASRSLVLPRLARSLTATVEAPRFFPGRVTDTRRMDSTDL